MSSPDTRLPAAGPSDSPTLLLDSDGASVPLYPAAETPPPVFAGEYELLTPIGRGGMGVVYLARQRALRRTVAYKMLTHLDPADPETVLRFRGEAQTLARLQHPGIVQVFDSGTAGGNPYLAMEYVPGGSLVERFRAGRMAPREAARVVASLAAAVGYAHAHGIVHRDLKPANVLLTDDGRPKVADFGLARGLDDGHLTRTGLVAGTPAYMAPEQLLGRRDLTPALDVWALGVILFEALTGTVPFAGTDPQQVLTAILRREAVSPRGWQPDLPRDLETICLKCLQKEPSQRYATGAGLADDLGRFLDDRTIRARPVGAVEKGARWCRRNPLAAGLAAAVALTLSAATGVSLALADRAGRERANAVAAAEAEAALRRHAEQAAGAEAAARREADEMTAKLEDLLAAVRPGTDPMAGVRDRMDTLAEALVANPDQSLLAARVLFTLAITRRTIGDFAQAVRPIERAHAIRLARLGADDPLTRTTTSELAYTYIHVGRGADAVALLEPLAAAPPAADDPDRSHVLHLLRISYATAGRPADAEAIGERLLAAAVARYGEDHEETEWQRLQLLKNSAEGGQYATAIPVLKKAYARFRETADTHPDRFAVARTQLGRCLLENGQPAEALPYLKETYDNDLVRFGPTHPHTLYDKSNLARVYEACGRYAEAVPLRRELEAHFRAAGDAGGAGQNAKLAAENLSRHMQ